MNIHLHFFVFSNTQLFMHMDKVWSGDRWWVPCTALFICNMTVEIRKRFIFISSEAGGVKLAGFWLGGHSDLPWFLFGELAHCMTSTSSPVEEFAAPLDWFCLSWLCLYLRYVRTGQDYVCFPLIGWEKWMVACARRVNRVQSASWWQLRWAQVRWRCYCFCQPWSRARAQTVAWMPPSLERKRLLQKGEHSRIWPRMLLLLISLKVIVFSPKLDTSGI